MFVSMALLISMALATPPTVEEATRLHLAGASVEAVELLLPEIDQDPAAALALGRVFFANSQWALAEAAYHRVPRDSPLWFRSRLEATWAVYYLDPTHERAIARALLLYTEDPTDWELRYLIGILVLHCGGAGSGRVGELAAELLQELIEDLKAEINKALHPSTSLMDRAYAAEVLWWEIGGPRDSGLYEHQPRCGWASLGAAPQVGALSLDSPVTRAILLTLTGKQGRFRSPTGGCSLHRADCPDPRAHRKLDREARRWLRSYRDELD